MRELAVAAVLLCASVPLAAAGPAPAGADRALMIGPKQDDPLRDCGEEIGPKQDDPRTGIIVQGGRTARPGDDSDPQARGSSDTLAIGPKQDDPRKGIIVQGGRTARDDEGHGPAARQKARACRAKAKAKD
jgi:hypothetical protein